MKKGILRESEQIESDFFDIDETTKMANVCLHFESPDDIFDSNWQSKIPIFNDDFYEWLQYAFSRIPRKYKIAMEITFDDMGGYTSDQLNEIFRKNLLFSGKAAVRKVRSNNFIAIGLIVTGVFFLIAMMLLGQVWVTESFWHEIFFYFLDIVTTVLFWEAVCVLAVEGREHRATAKAYRERFGSICFK